MKRFLVIQTAFIGDVILATPVLSELKRLYPDATVDFLLRKGNESLLANHPSVDSIFTFDKKAGKLRSLLTLIKKIRSEKYDEVINLHRFASTGILTMFSGASSRVGFDKNPLSWYYTRKIQHLIGDGTHEVERNLSCLNHHGAAKKRRPEIYPSEADQELVRPYQNQAYYCLAPASVWFTKQLPEEKWIELAKRIGGRGKIYLMGGKGDWDLCERIRVAIPDKNSENLAGKLSFLQSAALFKGAKMNYVNDSGPLHFCSAVNAPVTAFFCSTTPEFGFGPLSDNSKIQQTVEKLSCKPCGLHGFKACPKGHFKCGWGIEVETL